MRWFAKIQDTVSRVKAIDKSKSEIHRFRRALLAGGHRSFTIRLNVLYTKEQLVKAVTCGMRATKSVPAARKTHRTRLNAIIKSYVKCAKYDKRLHCLENNSQTQYLKRSKLKDQIVRQSEC